MGLLDIDEFVEHETSGGGNKKYLKGWKEEGSITIWLHPKCPIVSLWQHSFPDVVTKKSDDGEVTKAVWSKRYRCVEEEETLQKQNFRDKETGEREYPPERCPICKLIEYVRAKVIAGEWDITTPIFKFGASDPTKSQTIHAGGAYNAFAKMSDADKALCKKAKIFDGWKENMKAKAGYVFGVISHEEPSKGVQLTTEGSGLGDKVKATILKERKSLGTEDGDIRKHPYALQWEYNDKEENPQKKYDCTAMRGVKITPEVRKAMEADPPNMESLLSEPNWGTLKAKMEKHCVAPGGLPFDEFFSDVDTKHQPASREEAAGDVDEFEGEETRELSAAGKQKLNEEIEKAKSKAPAPAEDDEEVACDTCGSAMKLTDTKCAACGTEYDADGKVIEKKPEPPPARKTRSELAAERAAAKKPPKSSPALSEDDDAPF